MTLTQRNKLRTGVRRLEMDNVRHCRAMGSLFRQFAEFDPLHSWKYLIEAQRSEHLAEVEINLHF